MVHRALPVGLLALLSACSAVRLSYDHADWEERFVDMLVELDRSLTPTQRATAVGRLRSYAGQFRALTKRDHAQLRAREQASM
jgi:hypothetical protein